MPTYYRNKVEISNIEPGALWRKSGDKLILVDDDQFVDTPFSKDHFSPAE